MRSDFASARDSSRTARRETTMLPRARSILRIKNGCGVPISGDTSRTGRISTCEPGRKATAPPRSTVKPPLTRPKITPVTRSSFSWDFVSSIHASSRRAFSRERTDSPWRFSMRSTNTSTLSPTLSSSSSPGFVNSCNGMRPSDLRPTSTIAKSDVREIMVPSTTFPVKLDCSLSEFSKSFAKSLLSSRSCNRAAAPAMIGSFRALNI